MYSIIEHPSIRLPQGMGFRELKIAARILMEVAKHGFPDDFDGTHSPVYIGFNPKSGCVYLANEDGDSAMMNGDRLEVWYYLGYSGTEGFFEDLRIKYTRGEIEHEEDREEFRQIAQRRGIYLI